jgi:hypothetical protein
MISSIAVHRFSFEDVSSPGYWSLLEVKVTVGNETYSFINTKVGAPLEFSYHCGQEVIFVNGSNMLNISSGFQVLYLIFTIYWYNTCGWKLPVNANLTLQYPCL